MRQDEVIAAIAKLDAWLETMCQRFGYAGPVAHWWESTYGYAGRGLDWRYQGILIGYATLLGTTGQVQWLRRVERALGHLVDHQGRDGTFQASRFEANPGTLGTPHEAAATHGLIVAGRWFPDWTAVRTAATRNLDHLIAQLWSPGDPAGSPGVPPGFNDAPGRPGRVPNKLATMAEALMTYAHTYGDDGYLPYARAALDEVLRYQESRGRWRGAIHQWGPHAGPGDGRFFPYYIARTVPALMQGADTFGDAKYGEAAQEAVEFLERHRHEDGTWPHVCYESGHRSEYPHWVAPVADILWAYRAVGNPCPEASLQLMLAGQLPSGGVRTAIGFGHRFRRDIPGDPPDFRDVTPVVGWNDKVLRLLAGLVPPGVEIPPGTSREATLVVRVGAREAVYYETTRAITLTDRHGGLLYHWDKASMWATVCHRDVAYA